MKRISPILLILILWFGGCASIAADPPSNNLQVVTTVLASAKVGEVYAQQLTASGGHLPYAWNLVSGQLPRGLEFNSSGVISGIPQVSGQFSFTVQVTDATGHAYSIQMKWRAV